MDDDDEERERERERVRMKREQILCEFLAFLIIKKYFFYMNARDLIRGHFSCRIESKIERMGWRSLLHYSY